MKLQLYPLRLPLAHAFTISRESLDSQVSLVVELEHDGLSGFGEVTENEFYGHPLPSIVASLQKVGDQVERYSRESPLALWDWLMTAVDHDPFAAAALDMAAHDWRGRHLGKPTWQDWGLTWEQIPDSSYTIGIDRLDTMVAKLREQPDWPIYKIKLGTPDDLEIVRRLRSQTDAIFRVDANGAWSAEQTIAYSAPLRDLGVQFIEQPLPHSASVDDKRRVFEHSALPIMADEDCQVPADVSRCVGLYHGVNVKICKCGGLTPALAMLQDARRLGLRTMVGCMVESSIGISGAAQLLPLLDYADLDGAVLLSDQPAAGVVVASGKIQDTAMAGTGAVLHKHRLAEFAL
jgi:L-alanine-DL-glutamate epimerase-like enolase superfamily enzyme